MSIDFTLEALKAFEALVRADERNRTWTQEHWTEYERSIAAVEREAACDIVDYELDSNGHAEAIKIAIRARGQA
jgi:hypothetical protein